MLCIFSNRRKDFEYSTVKNVSIGNEIYFNLFIRSRIHVSEQHNVLHKYAQL